MTPEELEQKAAQLAAQAEALRTQAQQQRGETQPISPRTKLPVSDPESQAVERIRYETGQSFCGERMTEAQIAALDEKPKS